MKKIIFLIFIIAILFGLASCKNNVYEKQITCEDIIKVYEEAGFDIFHKETTTQGYNWNCYVKCTAPNSDEYIFFYIFETNDEALAYAKERDGNILLYLFSCIYGDSSWLRATTYNNITIEYDHKYLYKPFETLR